MNKVTKILSVMLLATAAVSCSDNDEPVIDVASEVAATYQGYSVASSRYFEGQLAPSQTVTVAKTAAGEVDVTYASDDFGTFNITSAKVSSTSASGVYTVTGSGKCKMGMGGNVSEYDCTLEGTVDKANPEVTEFTFNIPAVMGGLKIKFVPGELPAAVALPGDYDGYTDASCAYFPSNPADDQELTITAQEGSDKFTVKYVSSTWGEFTIKDVTATANGNKFTLAGSGSTLMGMGDTKTEYACTLEGTVDVADEANTLFTFKVPAVMGGLTIEFRLGTRPAEAE